MTELFKANDRTRIVSMLPETFVLKIPETLPYGGSFKGPGEFDRFFQRIYDDHDYWSSFHTDLDRVLDAGTHLVAPIRVTARSKSSGATIDVENLWLFEIADGNFVRAQLYADTAAGRNVAKFFYDEDILHTFAEFSRGDGPADAIAHGYLTEGPVALFGADVAGDEAPFRSEGLMLALLGTAAPSTLRNWFSRLCEGGRVVDDLQTRPWGASDGQVTDRYGLRRLIGFEGDESD